MAASLSEILSAIQNLTQAISAIGHNFYLSVQGQTNFTDMTAATQVSRGSGRVCQISVIVAGSAPGHIYDSLNSGAPSRTICVIPNTVGIFTVNIPVLYGIVVVPGTGQTVTISYS